MTSLNVTTEFPGPEPEPEVPPNPDVECGTFVFVVYVVLLGSMCMFGLVGNTLSFCVLRRERRAHVATFLLCALAVVDNFYLIVVGGTSVYAALINFIGHSGNAIQAYLVVFIWPFAYIAQMAAVWMTVHIAFNRYIAICRPFQAPQLCTMHRTRVQLATLATLIVLYNIPRFCEFKISYVIVPGENTTLMEPVETPLKLNYHYNLIYENIMYCLFVFLGPLAILVTFNVCLVRELLRIRKRMQERHLPHASGGEDEENNLTLVMIIIIITFIFCQTPAFFNQILSLVGLPYECGQPYFYFYQLSNFIASLNSCFNFIVYCAFRRQFQQRLRAFCRCSTNEGAAKRTLDSTASAAGANGEQNGGDTVTVYVSDSRSQSSHSTCQLKPVNGTKL